MWLFSYCVLQVKQVVPLANNPDEHCSNNYSKIWKWQEAAVNINNTITDVLYMFISCPN